MFVTTKTRNPLHTNDDSDNDLLTLAKLMIISQLSSQQLIQIIENNQLKSLGNGRNSSRISLPFRNQKNSRNHCYQLTRAFLSSHFV